MTKQKILEILQSKGKEVEEVTSTSKNYFTIKMSGKTFEVSVFDNITNTFCLTEGMNILSTDSNIMNLFKALA